MKNTAVTKNILSHGKNIFRSLHYAKGFDFEKPILIFEGTGNFTLNGLKKVTEKAGINTAAAAICVIIDHKTKYNQTFRAVDVWPLFGGYDLFENRDLPYYNGSSLDNYWRKSDFDRDRKEKDITFYIIAQNAEFLQQPKKELKINFEQRVKIVDRDHYQQNGKTCYISSYRPYYRTNTEKTFDKSGYLLNDIRDNLARRAAAIRAEKEKQAAARYDTSAIITDIRSRYDRLKMAISEKLLAGEINLVYSVICDFRWLTNDVKTFETKTQKNEYNSIKRIKEDIASINKRMDVIFTKIA